MSQSAEDALRALKAKIKDSIEGTETTKRYAIGKEHYAAAYELSIKMGERTNIIYIIDEMLDELEKEEKHTHKWKWQSNIGFHCDCGIILSIKEVENRLNLDDNLYVGGNFTIGKKHTHRWEWRLDTTYRCDCGAFLTREQAEEYLNKWQEQLDLNTRKRFRFDFDTNKWVSHVD